MYVHATSTVLPPISTKNLTTADVDGLTQTTRVSMLEVLNDMYKSRADVSTPEVAIPQQASSTSVEI